MLDEQVFFRLLDETKVAFEKSKIRTWAQAAKMNWEYSVCATRIDLDSPLILGFNWGARAGETYQPQMLMPTKSFLELPKSDLGSLSRIIPLLHEFLGEDALRIGQSNFCFFRSKTAGQIGEDDLSLCRPLFRGLLRAARPSRILSLSSRLRKHLGRSGVLSAIEEKAIPIPRGTYTAVRARVVLEEIRCPIVFLPHPNYPMLGAARREAWAFCFDQ
jgi:hypothetical protein